MKLEQAIQVCQEYHKMNSGRNTIESYNSTLAKLRDRFGKDREPAAIASKEIFSFLAEITAGGKQQTKHGLYSHLKAFFNFIKTNLDSGIQNPCDAPILRRIYRPGKPMHWDVVEKETIDGISSRGHCPQSKRGLCCGVTRTIYCPCAKRRRLSARFWNPSRKDP